MSSRLPPLSMKRGTTSTITVTLPDTIDPVGATVFFTVKSSEVTRRYDDSDTYAVFKKTITAHTGRVFSDTIDPDDTADNAPGKYTYGFTVKDADGQVLGTKANGDFTIEPRDTADVGD